MASSQLTDVSSRYLRLIEKLNGKSGSSKAKVAAVLASTACEELASHVIMDGGCFDDDARFDSYYREKHEVAKRKFVDRLKSELTNVDSGFQIRTEEASDLGRRDVVITDGRQLTIETNGKTLPVEIKASVGLDLAQIERYLLSGEPLLLVRIMTGQVKLLKPSDFSAFLKESVRDLSDKALRILDGRPFLVTGYECNRCPVRSCPHNRTRKPIRGFVCMKQDEFDADLPNFLTNLYPTIDRAVQVTLKELGIDACSGAAKVDVSLEQVVR
jgi:hypothetical protein